MDAESTDVDAFATLRGPGTMIWKSGLSCVHVLDWYLYWRGVGVWVSSLAPRCPSVLSRRSSDLGRRCRVSCA